MEFAPGTPDYPSLRAAEASMEMQERLLRLVEGAVDGMLQASTLQMLERYAEEVEIHRRPITGRDGALEHLSHLTYTFRLRGAVLRRSFLWNPREAIEGPEVLSGDTRPPITDAETRARILQAARREVREGRAVLSEMCMEVAPKLPGRR